MAISLAMGLWPATEMMPLAYTGKTPTLRKATDIYQVTLFQEADIHFVTALDRANIISSELPKVANILQTSEMSFLWRIKPGLLDLALNKAYLDSIITILVPALYLSYHGRSRLNSGHRACFSAFLKQLRHPYFSADNAWKHGSNYNLISISTPDARSS